VSCECRDEDRDGRRTGHEKRTNLQSAFSLACGDPPAAHDFNLGPRAASAPGVVHCADGEFAIGGGGSYPFEQKSHDFRGLGPFARFV